MPKSPILRPSTANRVSNWVSQGKDIASKASDRASLTVKRKISKQNIGGPFTVTRADDVHLRRQYFRPLELSIYLPGNRLSDLPEFEGLHFTDTGEIQVPPKALIRTRSENMMQSFSKTTGRPTMSMVGERQLDYWQQRSSSLTSQRPPSAFEGLGSHPVVWTSLPGLPPQDEAVKPLSPMAEEEDARPLLQNTAENVILEFPAICEEEQHRASPNPAITALPPLSTQVPYKKPQRLDSTRLNSFNRTRISQWLSLSSSGRAASLDVQRPQFYQCAISPPVHQHSFSHSHPRFRTFSTSTLASSVGSPTESLASMTSMTTAPTLHTTRSRSGTLRSLGKRVTVVQEESMPDIPDLYAQVREIDVGKMPVTDSVRLGMAF